MKTRAAVAQSILDVPLSGVREIAEMALGMKNVLRLYFGESNIPTAEYLKRAAQNAMAEGHTFYTSNAGSMSLRTQICRYYDCKHSVTLDPAADVMATSSGIQSLYLAIRCVLDPGDHALMLTPQWPNASSIAKMSCATVTEVAMVRHGRHFQIDFDALEAAVTPRSRLLVYTSPSNPLGWVATPADQQNLLDFARRHNLWLLADEVYERLYYPQQQDGQASAVPPSILTKADKDKDAVLVAQSFSKAYSMTGWRLGWLAGRKDLIARAAAMNEYIMSCPASFTQRAAEVALAEGELHIEQMLAQLRSNRDLCLAALQKMPGMDIPAADGAFYLFPKIEGLTNSLAFCKRLLTETGVGIAPGGAFGAGGEGSLRICYAAEPAILTEALSRLDQYLRHRAVHLD
ncbi:aminotransferase [Bryobacterales bacterium F-183]|nr:aminotransferase [Bryobacterales bacterium F-183]